MPCKCGASCACGDNCSCEMYVEQSSVGIVQGVAPLNNMNSEGAEKSFGAEGCKCGSSCTCDPCNC